MVSSTFCKLAVTNFERTELNLNICALIPNEACLCDVNQLNVIKGHRETIITMRVIIFEYDTLTSDNAALSARVKNGLFLSNQVSDLRLLCQG